MAAVLPRAGRALTIATFEDALKDVTGTCDLTRLTFIDAYGVVGTACALEAAEGSAGLTVLLPDAAATRSHLSAMGFGDFLATLNGRHDLPPTPVAQAPDVVVPLRSTADSQGAQALSNLLWEQLERKVAPQVLHALADGVWELVANAHEHSGGDALVMGQVYRRPRGQPPDHDDRVQIVVGDTGRGFRRSFTDSGVRLPATDLDAVKLALEYLVSSVDDPGRGVGLFDTMKNVLSANGRMVVRTGVARTSITAESRTDEAVPFLPGVVVGLSLPLYG